MWLLNGKKREQKETAHRIENIHYLLNIREMRRYLRRNKRDTVGLAKLASQGVSDRIIFISSNPELLKIVKASIKGNIHTMLVKRITFELIEYKVFTHYPDVLVLDYQTKRDEYLMDALVKRGYEVHEF